MGRIYAGKGSKKVVLVYAGKGFFLVNYKRISGKLYFRV